MFSRWFNIWSRSCCQAEDRDHISMEVSFYSLCRWKLISFVKSEAAHRCDQMSRIHIMHHFFMQFCSKPAWKTRSEADVRAYIYVSKQYLLVFRAKVGSNIPAPHIWNTKKVKKVLNFMLKHTTSEQPTSCFYPISVFLAWKTANHNQPVNISRKWQKSRDKNCLV